MDIAGKESEIPKGFPGNYREIVLLRQWFWEENDP